MKFDLYNYFTNKEGKICPGIIPNPTEWSDIKKRAASEEVCGLIDSYRKTADADNKKMLPSVCYMGTCTEKRAVASMIPTQAIMIDIDHVEEPANAYAAILADADRNWWVDNCLLWHITCSGHGLRGVIWAQEGCSTVEENLELFDKLLHLSNYGDFDKACKDFSRISFLPKADEILYESAQLFTLSTKKPDGLLTNSFEGDVKKSESQKVPSDSIPDEEYFTEEERKQFDVYEYRGTPVKAIIERYVEVQGKPGSGEVHNYYNCMVKYFRNITNNDKRALLYLLPRFGHTRSECESSIRSICKVNTLSQLDKPFYFFLKDNGFYKPKTPQGEMAEYMMADGSTEEQVKLPWLPPVFRELVGICPKDFKVSAINSLLPIMGTLTSYLRGKYYYDGRWHTTSFFSIIYAPAGTGKGFVTRYMEVLFEMLKLRDYVQSARESIYLNILNRKGDNDKAPEDPHTSLRIIPPKNSESEFLTKQKDNHGYHMFTYAAEMDSWAKGAKAAGGNKDDMIRIAWDNEEYGQQFKSTTTFKGKVALYWNVLITGTLPQIQSYFRNVENGLVTRCSFTTIDNQEFAPAPVWKDLAKTSLGAVRKFMDRCDRNSYVEPCTVTMEDVDATDAAKFEEEIDWRFTFRPRQDVNMEWLKPTIDNFLEEQRKRASLDYDKARDVFRRRVAVRGFRLGLICYALWEKPRKCDLEKCIPFINWWMHEDLESSLKLWGAQYNNVAEDTPNLAQRSLYNQLPERFTKNDVYVLCMKQGIKTPVRMIVHQWAKLGYVNKETKNDYVKVRKA